MLKGSKVMFCVMKFGRYVTVDDGSNYVMFHELNVRIKIKKEQKSAVTTAPQFLL